MSFLVPNAACSKYAMQRTPIWPHHS
jgi:hypothetical protein